MKIADINDLKTRAMDQTEKLCSNHVENQRW